jgi:ABC-type Zn2+ transport system substrate-binding protein/surface adhesin
MGGRHRDIVLADYLEADLSVIVLPAEESEHEHEHEHGDQEDGHDHSEEGHSSTWSPSLYPEECGLVEWKRPCNRTGRVLTTWM